MELASVLAPLLAARSKQRRILRAEAGLEEEDE